LIVVEAWPFALFDYAISDGVLYGLRDDQRIVKTTDLLSWTLLDNTPATDGRSIAILNNTLYVGATDGRLYRYSVPVPEPAGAVWILPAALILARGSTCPRARPVCRSN